MADHGATSAADWWRSWLHPAALFALLAVFGSAYAAVLLQRERIARLEARIAVIEADYSRRETVVLHAMLHAEAKHGTWWRCVAQQTVAI